MLNPLVTPLANAPSVTQDIRHVISAAIPAGFQGA